MGVTRMPRDIDPSDIQGRGTRILDQNQKYNDSLDQFERRDGLAERYRQVRFQGWKKIIFLLSLNPNVEAARDILNQKKANLNN